MRLESPSSRCKSTKMASTASAPADYRTFREVLKVPITFFFDGALQQRKQGDQPTASITRLLATPEGLALVVAFEKIKGKARQRAVVRLVETIASDGN